MELPPDILLRPPEEAVARIARSWLAEARAAGERLDDPDDGEALHDFRVAIRRLRSTLRAWRRTLAPKVPGAWRRELQEIQRATGAGRDAEVALEWLESQEAELAPGERAGLALLVALLEERRETSLAQAREGVRRRFDALDARLSERLGSVHVRVDLASPTASPRFGAALAARLRTATDRLEAHLSGIGEVEDPARCHAARIAGKRLRYLLEPVRAEAEEAIAECRRLQDRLGDLNDAHVLAEEIARVLEDAGPEAQPGLRALRMRAEARAAELFAAFRGEWLGAAGAPRLAGFRALADHFESEARPALEIERKYLLDGLPDLEALRARGVAVESFEILQGWLPGRKLRERIRRTLRSGAPPDEARHFRTIKLGAGVERLEIEEAAGAPTFEALWPLTEGCRVRKRRHCVRAGEWLWEIDEFLDRDLVLAEVELPDPEARAELPAWLSDRVVREVTDDPRYTNLKLAR